MQVANIGPGTYIGNAVTFGRDCSGVKIPPPRTVSINRNEDASIVGPGSYSPDKAIDLTKSKIPSATIKKNDSFIYSTMQPSAKCGMSTKTRSVSCLHSQKKSWKEQLLTSRLFGHPSTDKSFNLLKEDGPDPGYYQSNLNDFGKFAKNVFLG